MQKLRTIREAFRCVKEADPQTALTPTALRRLVLSGDIPSTRIGTKRLITLESLEKYFCPEPQQLSIEPSRGTIRHVEV